MIVILRERGFVPYCGRVLDDRANPIAGVSIIGRQYDGSVVAETTTEVDGTWGLSDLGETVVIEIWNGATKVAIDSLAVSVDVGCSTPWWRKLLGLT